MTKSGKTQHLEIHYGDATEQRHRAQDFWLFAGDLNWVATRDDWQDNSMTLWGFSQKQLVSTPSAFYQLSVIFLTIRKLSCCYACLLENENIWSGDGHCPCFTMSQGTYKDSHLYFPRMSIFSHECEISVITMLSFNIWPFLPKMVLPFIPAMSKISTKFEVSIHDFPLGT